MPIDLESKEVQRKMFYFFLYEALVVRRGQTIVESGKIRVNSNSFNSMIQSFTDVDEHTASDIAGFLVEKNLYRRSNESFILLEAMDESTIDDLALINKWVIFYEYSIDSLKKAHNFCKEAVKRYTDKISKLLNITEKIQQEVFRAKNNYEMIVEKEKQHFLTADERRKKEIADVEFRELEKLSNMITFFIENTYMRSRIEYIEWFANNADIAIASMENVKAVLELAKSTEIKDLLGTINETIAKIDSGSVEVYEEKNTPDIERTDNKIHFADSSMCAVTKKVEKNMGQMIGKSIEGTKMPIKLNDTESNKDIDCISLSDTVFSEVAEENLQNIAESLILMIKDTPEFSAIEKKELLKCVKALLEISSSNIKENAVNDINKIISIIDNNCVFLPDSSEVTEENLQEFAEIMGMTFNDIPNLMAAAKEDLEKISKTRKDLESRNNNKSNYSAYQNMSDDIDSNKNEETEK